MQPERGRLMSVSSDALCRIDIAAFGRGPYEPRRWAPASVAAACPQEVKVDTSQVVRDRQAFRLVEEWMYEKGLSAQEILAELRAYADDPRHLHFTPHLITAIRDARLWPSIQAAEFAT